MRHRLVRAAVPCVLACALLGAGWTASASAVTTTRITSSTPALTTVGGRPTLAVLKTGGVAPEVTISGVATGDGDIDLTCRWGTTASGRVYSFTINRTGVDEPPVTPDSDGSFTWTGNLAAFGGGAHACLLQAVPAATEDEQMTGPVVHSVAAFQPVQALVSSFGLQQSPSFADPRTIGYFLEAVGHRGSGSYRAATGAGFVEHALYGDGFFASAGRFINGSTANAALPSSIAADETAQSTSGIDVDGRPAYTPHTAASARRSGIPADAPEVTATASLDAATGDVTAVETSPLVWCAQQDGSASPIDNPGWETDTSCARFVSAGVSLERTLVQRRGGRETVIGDRYAHTGGGAHTVSLRYQHTTSAGIGTPVALVPGDTTFAPLTGRDTDPLVDPAGGAFERATLYLRAAAATKDGDWSAPHLAVTWAAGPHEDGVVPGGGPDRVTVSDEDLWETAYDNRPVPVGGAYVVRVAYATSPFMCQLQAWAVEQATGTAASGFCLRAELPAALPMGRALKYGLQPVVTASEASAVSATAVLPGAVARALGLSRGAPVVVARGSATFTIGARRAVGMRFSRAARLRLPLRTRVTLALTITARDSATGALQVHRRSVRLVR